MNFEKLVFKNFLSGVINSQDLEKAKFVKTPLEGVSVVARGRDAPHTKRETWGNNFGFMVRASWTAPVGVTVFQSFVSKFAQKMEWTLDFHLHVLFQDYQVTKDMWWI